MKTLDALRKFQFFALTGYATFLSLVPQPGAVFESFWDKSLHFICWLVLCLSLRLALPGDKRLYAAAAALFAYSIAIEIIQHFLPARQFSGLDIVANGMGIASGLLVISLAIKIYRSGLLPPFANHKR